MSRIGNRGERWIGSAASPFTSCVCLGIKMRRSHLPLTRLRLFNFITVVVIVVLLVTVIGFIIAIICVHNDVIREQGFRFRERCYDVFIYFYRSIRRCRFRRIRIHCVHCQSESQGSKTHQRPIYCPSNSINQCTSEMAMLVGTS